MDAKGIKKEIRRGRIKFTGVKSEGRGEEGGGDGRGKGDRRNKWRIEGSRDDRGRMWKEVKNVSVRVNRRKQAKTTEVLMSLISCVLNCEEMVNPSKRLLLESKCLNCEVGTRIQYQWSVYICNKTLLSCQMLPNFRIKTSTGLQSANLAIKENALEIGAIYRVRCAAWKLGSPNAGYVEYLLTVNSPPINGQCSVMPKRGFALDTLFHVSCSGWWDKEKPITYFVGMFFFCVTLQILLSIYSLHKPRYLFLNGTNLYLNTML